MALAKTKREKLQEAARQLRQRAILERWLMPRMRRELRLMATDAATGYTEGGMERALVTIDSHKIAIEGLLNTFYEKVITKTSEGLKAWLPTIEKKDFFGAVDRLINYFRGTALSNSVSIAETTKDEVRQIMEPMIANFETEGTIAKAIESKLKKQSRSRAQMIARTESGIAVSKSQFDLVQEVETLPMKKEWVTTFRDSRDSHKDIDGTKIEKHEAFKVRRQNGGYDQMQHPHDRAASAGNIYNCLHPSTVIGLCHPNKLFRRHYVGEIIEIEISSEHKLTVTPNHPILTKLGWKSARLINEGDELIVDAVRDGINSVNVDIEAPKATVGEMYDSFLKNRYLPSVTSGIVDFHGDATNPDVDIISVDRELMNSIKPTFETPIEKGLLQFSETSRVCLMDESAMDEFMFRSLLSSNCVVSGFGDFLDVVRACLAKSDPHGLAASSGLESELFHAKAYCISLASKDFRHFKNGIALDVEIFDFINNELPRLFSDLSANTLEPSIYGAIRYSYEFSYLERLFPRLIKLFDSFISFRFLSKRLSVDVVTKISTHEYDGPVYNIEDTKSFYSASTIINHNCMCVMIFVPAFDVGDFDEEAAYADD
ncbi:MAG: hypothetical protein CO099_06240 [Bdellovibrio sp. CG_4_9_14_3_um_filter_39_7]|nr:MAG: hypothetical protein CO099_06240 [Bdellovibrio sp. CG_4_9_14_3_um_filter_39_7]